LNGTNRGTAAQAHSNTSYGTNPIYGSLSIGKPLTLSLGQAECKPNSTFENAGIRTGEIIGYRVWFVQILRDGSCSLRSYSYNHTWVPGNYLSPNGADEGTAGFHAHKTMRRVRQEYPLTYLNHYGGVNTHLKGFAYGEVKLWGTVYEHTEGYRAEYARVHRLTDIYMADHMACASDVFEKLQRVYGCEIGRQQDPQIIVDSSTWTGRK